MEAKVSFKSCVTLFGILSLLAFTFSPAVAVEPHAISLPIVEVTVDEDSFALIGSTPFEGDTAHVPIGFQQRLDAMGQDGETPVGRFGKHVGRAEEL